MSVPQYNLFSSDADRLQLEGVPLDGKRCCVLCGREERPLVPAALASRRLGRSLVTAIEELVGSDISGSVPQAASSGSVPQADSSGCVPRAASSESVPQAASSGSVPQAASSGSVPQAASSGSVHQADSSGNVPQAASTLVCPPCLRLIQVRSQQPAHFLLIPHLLFIPVSEFYLLYVMS
jgi:hypothetical protein